MALTYEFIASQTLGSDNNYITFSSLGSYTDIIAVLYIRSTTTGQFSDNYMRFATGGGGVDTGTNYSSTRMFAAGTSPAVSRTTNQNLMLCGIAPAGTANANMYGSTIVHINNYSNATTNKTALIRSTGLDTSAGYVTSDVTMWRNTGAITSIQFIINANYKTGSKFTLYGIKAA